MQFIEIEVVYPGWAQFIGAVIILTAVLPMPITLIVRLILYKTAREEAVDFLKKLRTDAERTYRLFINCRSVAIGATGILIVVTEALASCVFVLGQMSSIT